MYSSPYHNITCREHFYFNESSQMCIPECGVWTLHSDTAEHAINTILIVGTVSGILINMTILLAFIIQHKKNCKYMYSVLY